MTTLQLPAVIRKIQEHAVTFLQLLEHPLTEVRILTGTQRINIGGQKNKYVGSIISGYYTPEHYPQMVKDVAQYDGQVRGIYNTIHSIDPALHARAHNRLRTQTPKGETTSDHNITHLDCFAIDIDPDCPAGVSSSEAELDEVKKRAAALAKEFEGHGIMMIRGLSGNGCHLITPIVKTAVNDDVIARYEAMGKSIANAVGADIKIYNPARILKMYGTVACKGDNTEERPHRRSSIYIPPTVARVELDRLEDVIYKIAPQSTETTTVVVDKPKTKSDDGPEITLEQWLEEKDVPILGTKEGVNGGTVYYVTCPFNSEHTGTDAYCFEGEKWGFQCHHNSCEGKDWYDFKAAVGGTPVTRTASPTKSVRRTDRDVPLQSVYVGRDEQPVEVEDEAEVATETPIEFPEELFASGTIFEKYRDAYAGRTEVCPAFHFAALKTVIGASLGRRVCLDGVRPLYPNFYTALIGQTGYSKKTTAMECGKAVLEMADTTVYSLSTLSTPEGLINAFVMPDGYSMGMDLDDHIDIEAEENPNKLKGLANLFGGIPPQLREMIQQTEIDEGFRIIVTIDELAGLLKKAGKQSSEGLMQLLAEAYNYPRSLHSPTKVNPIKADYPCLTMLGCTTREWFESSFKLEDIQGGVANRITYYFDDGNIEDIFLDQPGDAGLLQEVAKELNSLRRHYKHPTLFQFDEEVKEHGTSWYAETREATRKEANELVRMASQRMDVHVKKASLLFATLWNDDGDTEIHLPEFYLACKLADYLKQTIIRVYDKFDVTWQGRVEEKIIEVLRAHPNSTGREIKHKISWVSRKDINESLDQLIKSEDVVARQNGRRIEYAIIKGDGDEGAPQH